MIAEALFLNGKAYFGVFFKVGLGVNERFDEIGIKFKLILKLNNNFKY